MSTPRAPKLDLPFRTETEILDLVARFEDRTWPYERWTHRAHLAVAAFYLQHYSFDDALARIRHNIKAYTHPHNPGGYHETITALFMTLISAHLHASTQAQDLTALVDQLFGLYDMKTPLEYYSQERLWSADARQELLEPDLKPLPQPAIKNHCELP